MVELRVRGFFWQGAFTGIGGTAIAASLAFFLVAQPLRPSLPGDLVSAHVRSLMPEHLIDVVSTDKHTVKPWFSGHADVSPAVADFEMQGYKLIGGRADYLGHQRVAVVVVYQRGSHIINVFSWDANQSALPRNLTRGGYHLAFWQSGDIAYCAISDTGWGELTGLAKLIQASSEQQSKRWNKSLSSGRNHRMDREHAPPFLLYEETRARVSYSLRSEGKCALCPTLNADVCSVVVRQPSLARHWLRQLKCPPRSPME